MKILVIGGGGREHTIVWKLAQSRLVDKIYCTPGNAGISEIAECIEIGSGDLSALVDFVKYNWIDCTIVGPEEPLSRGIVDIFEKEGRRIVGPSRTAAQLESSKVFAKEFMKRHRIPSAGYRVFSSYLHAEEYLRMKGAPIVVKAEGLAAGKGVFVAASTDEAIDALRIIMKEKAFGKAGDRVVLEECLEGEEASFMVFTDGAAIVPMVSSQDHKRVFDEDEGPNTGGMGAYSPAPVITPELEKVIMDTIMRPAIEGLREEGVAYRGILYAGLMIVNGAPYVLEFNCRLGDPETQPVITRLESDLVDICFAITEGRLSQTDIVWRQDASVCVVLASGGYPGTYAKGKVITGLEDVKQTPGVTVFHAGTAFHDNAVVTSGGRVLGVTALGSGIAEAQQRAYEAIQKIHFEGMHFRRDIAARALRWRRA